MFDKKYPKNANLVNVQRSDFEVCDRSFQGQKPSTGLVVRHVFLADLNLDKEKKVDLLNFYKERSNLGIVYGALKGS